MILINVADEDKAKIDILLAVAQELGLEAHVGTHAGLSYSDTIYEMLYGDRMEISSDDAREIVYSENLDRNKFVMFLADAFAACPFGHDLISIEDEQIESFICKKIAYFSKKIINSLNI